MKLYDTFSKLCKKKLSKKRLNFEFFLDLEMILITLFPELKLQMNNYHGLVRLKIGGLS